MSELKQWWCAHASRVAGLSVMLLIGAPPSGAAQEPLWAVSASTGPMVPTGGSSTAADVPRVDLGAGWVVLLDVRRTLRPCCVEVQAGASFGFATGVDIGAASAGSLAPSGVQLGVNFRLYASGANSLHAMPFVGAIARDRSEPVALGADRVFTLSFPGGWGPGVGASYRRRLKERLSLDASVRWHRITVHPGEHGRIRWNPLTLTAGIAKRF